VHRGTLLGVVLAVAVASGSGGCVAKSKYLEAQKSLRQCENKLDKRRTGTSPNADLVAQLQPLIARGVLDVVDQDGRTVIGMRANVLFPSGSAQLSAEGRDTVQQVGRVLARKTDLDWQVEGHTDNQPISSASFPDNWHLGAARAISVLDVMVKAGMSPDHVSAATFGEFAPIASNSSDDGRSRNRRIEIVLLPEVAKRTRKKAG
jgi:chemotaxis protein MotB